MVHKLTDGMARLLSSPGADRVRYWLLLLEEPGQCMTFIPADLGLSAHSIQIYVNTLSTQLKEQGLAYRVRADKGQNIKSMPSDQPVYVYLAHALK